MDDRQVTPQCFNVAGELAPVCAQLVLKCLYLTRTGRTDLTVDRKNMLARSVTQKNTACGQRSARLLSFTNHSKHCRPYGFVGNTMKDLQTLNVSRRIFCQRLPGFEIQSQVECHEYWDQKNTRPNFLRRFFSKNSVLPSQKQFRLTKVEKGWVYQHYNSSAKLYAST